MSDPGNAFRPLTLEEYREVGIVEDYYLYFLCPCGRECVVNEQPMRDDPEPFDCECGREWQLRIILEVRQVGVPNEPDEA